MFVVDDKWQVDKDLSQSRPLLMPCQVLLLQRIFGVMPSKWGNNNAINNYLVEMFYSLFFPI
jgi:hypothetical protein